MEQPLLPDWGIYGPSPQLWGNIPLDHIFGPMGRNYGIGLRDDFLEHPATTLYSGYVKVLGTGCTIAMIPSTGGASATTALGIASLSVDGNASDDECVMQYGNALDVGPFKISAGDLGFEARFSVSAITAGAWSWFIGLATGGAAGAGITAYMFDTDEVLYATNSFIGFQHLYAEEGPVDGMYQLTSQTKQDGATKTKLDTLHTMVASTYVKLGFRYKADSNTFHWFVNGDEVEGAALTTAEVAAATFPDAVFLTPTVGIKDKAGNAALILNLDWWMTAQAF